MMIGPKEIVGGPATRSSGTGIMGDIAVLRRGLQSPGTWRGGPWRSNREMRRRANANYRKGVTKRRQLWAEVAARVRRQEAYRARMGGIVWP